MRPFVLAATASGTAWMKRWILIVVSMWLVAAGAASCSAADISSVVDAIQPRSVKVEAKSTDVLVNDTLRLTATARDSTGAVLATNALLVPTWAQTGGSGIVLITADGLATGNSPGPVEVTATMRGVQGKISLNVLNLGIDSVALAGGFNGCTVGGRTTVLAQTYLKGQAVTVRGRTFVWTTSDSSVVRFLPDTSTAWSRAIECATPGVATITVAVEQHKASMVTNVAKQ